METAKLSTEELEKLQGIQQKNAALINELGQISLSKINIKSREENAEKFLQELREEEQVIAKGLEEKYGIGTINLDKGEFIPTPTQDQAIETETVEV